MDFQEEPPRYPERGCVQRTSRSNHDNRPHPKVPYRSGTAKLLRLILLHRTQSRSVRADRR